MRSSKPEVWIRRMGEADLDRVVEIGESLPEAPQWPASAYGAAINPLHRPRKIALVAVDPVSDALAGFLVAGLVAPEAELETIAVAAEAQRRGAGGLLLRALVEELRAERVTELILEVRASNRTALGFYRAQGFKETGRRPRYYADPEEDAVLMGLNLA
jgi:[ribosomal protein S18]-alanine N-acetyltransferase